jgi:hypothetical protein
MHPARDIGGDARFVVAVSAEARRTFVFPSASRAA